MADVSEMKVVFRIGEETNPVVMDRVGLSESPFCQPVMSALRCVESIYEANRAFNGAGSKDKLDTNVCDEKWEERTYNNIVAFLGERGSGKTSCMRTMVRIAEEDHPKWMMLEEIDPSFFDETHTILDIFVGSLYGVHKKNLENWGNLKLRDQDDLRNISSGFRRLKSAMKYLDRDVIADDSYTETDELLHLNEGGKLRVLLKELVDAILEYNHMKFLVVSIDDLDLNVAQSYVMMEHIRKYLVLPNMAILIAAKYSQLSDSICLYLTKYFKDIPHRVTKRDVAEMAERYITKLLPLTQRCNMPMVESYLYSKLEIVEADGNGSVRDMGRIVDYVPSLIFEKTRFLFYNKSDIPSLVIPRNLRDLRMLIGLLYPMEPFSDDKDHGVNQRVFKAYLYDEWSGIIEPEYQFFRKSLLEEEDPAKINRFVVDNLYNLFLKQIIPFEKLEKDVERAHVEKTFSSYDRERELLRDIINPENSYWNVSIGDVVAIINVVRKLHDSKKVLDLLFFVETFYSIKLYEFYNEMTSLTTNRGIEMPKDDITTSPELKNSVHADIPSYFRFVGGSFFSTTGDSFIPPARGLKGGFRERRLINGRILTAEIQQLIKDYDDYWKGGANENDKQERSKKRHRLAQRLRLCEFFMLTVKERVDLKSNEDVTRQINEPIYFKKFGNTVKNLMFDVTAPFFNAIYPDYAYERFDKRIVEIAQLESDSLYTAMTVHNSRRKKNSTWDLMSKVSIRNMEILQDLYEWLHNRRESLRVHNAPMFGILKDFYSSFDTGYGNTPTKGYFVKTYAKSSRDVIEEENVLPYYYVDYSVLSVLNKLFDEFDPDMEKDKEDEELTMQLYRTFESILTPEFIIPFKDSYTSEEIRDMLSNYCSKSVALMEKLSGNEEIHFHELAEVLADVRYRYGYSFEGRLPFPLDSLYKIELEDKFNNEENRIEEALAEAEASLESRHRDLGACESDLREIKRTASDRKKERKAIEKSKAEIQVRMQECDDNLEYFERELGNMLIGASDRSRLMKEREKWMKTRNELSARSKIQSMELESIDVEDNENPEELSALDARIKALRKDIREATKKVESLKREKNKLNVMKGNTKRLKD